MTKYLLSSIGFVLLLARMPAAAQEEDNPETLWGTWADETASSGHYQCNSRWGLYPFDEAKALTRYFILFKVDASDDSMQSLWSARRYPDVAEIAAQPGYRRR